MNFIGWRVCLIALKHIEQISTPDEQSADERSDTASFLIGHGSPVMSADFDVK